MAKRLFGNTPPATTLVTTGGVNSSAVSLAPSTVTNWPDATTGEFPIKIDQEIMLVTNYVAPNWTVARGQEGTTAAAHSEGAQIRMPVTKESIFRLAIQSLAGTISGARRQINWLNTGGIFFTLADDPTNEKTDVSAGRTPSERTIVVPVLSGFTVDVSSASGATITQQSGYVLLSSPTQTTDKCIIATKAAPSTPYSIIAKVQINSFSLGFISAGIMVMDSGTAKMHRLVHQMNDRNLVVDRYTNKTTFSANDKQILIHGMELYPWLQLRDDGTNFTFSASCDGTNWQQLFQISRTAFLATPNTVGLVMNTNMGSTALPSAMKVLSWEQTA